MFEGFANVWTPVERARSVRAKPVAVRVAGEDVVLFRGRNNAVAALIDRCPHRGVALSLGSVSSDGCLECPFHGWRYDTTGACTRVPLNAIAPDKLARFTATSVPVREAGGLIWLYTAPGDVAAGEPPVPEAMVAGRFARWVHTETWNTHWTRAMENMLDSPHVPFVHRRTIGRGIRRAMRDDSVMVMDTEETAQGFRISYTLDDSPRVGAFLEFARPNGMVLTIPIPGKHWKLFVWCVPIDATHTNMVVASARDWGVNNPFMRLGDEFNRIVVMEDKKLVESSRPAEVPSAGDELSVASDKPTLTFRRYYMHTLKPSSAEPPARNVVDVGSLVARRAVGEGA